MGDENEPTADDEAGEGTAEVSIEVTEIDVDGDGVPDIIDVVTTTVIDVDGDGVPDIVDVVEAIGVDVDGDGVISDDEIEVTETIIVREDDAPEA